MQTDSNFQPDPAMAQMSESLVIFSDTVLIVYLAILIIVAIGLWKMFTKAGIPGILAFIPIVNLFFIPQVGGKPAWWAILYFIPIVQIIFIVLTYMAIAERFGRGVGTVLGLFFLTPIFVCILGFGSAQWTPPANDA